MGIAFRIITDAKEFSADQYELKINYTPIARNGSIQVTPQGLLSQTGITPTDPVAVAHSDWHTLLWPSEGDVPFDLFSAAFFLLSRYEEYAITQRDDHGRFEARNSAASRHGFLRIPIVDLWVSEFKKVLIRHQPSLVFQQHTFTSLSTIDVDFAYLYKGLGWKRWAGKLGRSLLGLNIRAVVNQLAVTAGIKKDPYDTYGMISEKTSCELAYFMLMNGSGGYDKAATHQTLRPLINQLKQHAQFIGIHPSYASNTKKELLGEEISALNTITGQPVLCSRQHFLKLAISDSYRSLLHAGIQHDYTMMYAEEAGFRAGTCFPFFYYDLLNEEITPLTIHSTCAMDVTLQNYMGLTAREAIELLQQLRESTLRYHGRFITLWHNNTLSAQQPEEWRDVYFSIFSTKTTVQN